ncbi:trace amine-associated receptor 13c-like [Lates calcarifer]|uniref:Trace amine-associated receptor 13c-like n=1 Tax=Lates calcarifer TaxID=8187 RepID=A0AAJ8B2Z1_LATCA|nr:trace amine-associated receptor 13c-like [Lates calcarifer]
MEALEEIELCFPQVNTSCKKLTRPHSKTILIFSVLWCITLLTVVLNLLVIISISHFRQLHTTTNLLLLSLAVADFLVGFMQMPAEIPLFGGCWMLGDLICALNYFLGFLTVSVSVGSMVLISVDRYMAICDPMFYSTKITVKKVQLCICLCWIFSAVHSSWILRDVLKQPDKYISCYGECVVVSSFTEGMVDLVVTFLGPILVITLLYLRVFVVAVSQARAMRSHIAAVTLQRSETGKAKKSEMKIWLLYFNSCLNPVIYVFFYPWFRKSIKHIVTLQILQPGSCEVNLMYKGTVMG